MIDDLDELRSAVGRLTGTTDDVWVPVWRQLGSGHEKQGDHLDGEGDREGAEEYLLAKTYYSIGRFPGVDSLEGRGLGRLRARLPQGGRPPRPAAPAGGGVVRRQGNPLPLPGPQGASPSSPVAAVLIMCGADVFKEDRGWAAEYALASGLASLVMDAPEPTNPLPLRAGIGQGLDGGCGLAGRPARGGRGRHRRIRDQPGGYSVMQLAGTYPERVAAAVAIAGNHFGYRMSPEEAEAFVEMQNVRSTYVFGAPGDGPTFKPTTLEDQEELFRKWSLTDLGLADFIVCPVLMINGKRDHLAPIGNIYDAGAGPAAERGGSIPTTATAPSSTARNGAPRCSTGLLARLA